MDFALFVLLNAVLLIRPEELFPEITGLRLYLICALLCTLTSLPKLTGAVSVQALRNRPVAACILLFFASTIVSLGVWGRIPEVFDGFGAEFAKVILYYFLLIAIVDTRERFRAFVACLVVLIGGLTAIALAQQYGITDFPNIKPAIDGYIDPQTGEEVKVARMVSTGIFNDPNDLCLVLGLGILSCVYRATTNESGVPGLVLWLLPIPIFVFALLETHSRGGLLGVLAGGSAFIYSRFGGPKALPYAAAGAVAIVIGLGGRQGNISGGGTAHDRLMFWAVGMAELLRQPWYIPIGLGLDWFQDSNGLVAHNSFVQAYVELGLLGGGSFLGAFYLGARILDSLGRGVDAAEWAVEARHYGFAVLIGYAMGCYSVTRNFVIPTYLALGLASVLIGQATPTLPERFQVNKDWFLRTILFSICGLVLIKMVTQILGMFGV